MPDSVSQNSKKRSYQEVVNEGIERTPDMPHLGESGHFCIELFCGSGNLTYAMKHFFPDSFGVDHKVSKQRVKTICLDFKLAEESATSRTVVSFRTMSVGPLGHSLRNSITCPFSSTQQAISRTPTFANRSLAGWHTYAIRRESSSG